MDRRRVAGALLALTACIAATAAAPTVSDHTALDVYDGATEGCYYNFQHYGEGDRIMTNEPCLNCTCHNRMLMCYLRVCPFTKAIGQDCTVEKRADQCCPIVTCPDVPVDLLTSTSTTSPAEYGATGVGKVDNYGCSINGKYFPEGAKVPPTPNKPCEHCYCIRNMTTCVMQECTLHVDGCTPIYHKDVCCPVRYFCDHPEDEMPLLDDMTTTVRPTPGFLLTTTTETPTTVTTARRDCVENDQLHPDGALIKTEKPCVHCYCMKGDIVCVVQECGTPMENEGKNCTSLPPREGQCCPDTYICEGDELPTDLLTETPFDDITTLLPPRRVSVEGSGYRNEPDEVTVTEVPTFSSEIEGSGEEQTQEPTKHDLLVPHKDEIEGVDENLATTKEGIQLSASTTRIPMIEEEEERVTTEPAIGQNTVPSDEEEGEEPPIKDKTTVLYDSKVTEPTMVGHDMVSSGDGEINEPSIFDKTSPQDEVKVTESTIASEQHTTTSKNVEEERTEPSMLGVTSPNVESKVTEPSIVGVQSTVTDETTSTFEGTSTESPIVSQQSTVESVIPEKESTEPSIIDITTLHGETEETTKPTAVSNDGILDQSSQEKTTPEDGVKVTEPTIVSEHTTVSSEIIDDEKTKLPVSEITTPKYEDKTIKPSLEVEPTTVSGGAADEDISKPSIFDETTTKDLEKATEPSVADENTSASVVEDETSEQTLQETTRQDEAKVTEPERERVSEQSTMTSAFTKEEIPEMSTQEITTSEEKTTKSAFVSEPTTGASIIKEEESSETSALAETTVTSVVATVPILSAEESSESSGVEKTTPSDESKIMDATVEMVTSIPTDDQSIDTYRTSPKDVVTTTESSIITEKVTNPSVLEEGFSSEHPLDYKTTLEVKEETTEPAIASEQTTLFSKVSVEESSTPTVSKVSPEGDIKVTEPSTENDIVTIAAPEDRRPEESITIAGDGSDSKFTEPTVQGDGSTNSYDYQSSSLPDILHSIADENLITTEPAFRKEDDSTETIDKFTQKDELPKETAVTPELVEATSTEINTPSLQETDKTVQPKEPTTESFLELSTFAHITQGDKDSNVADESDVSSSTPINKVDLPETTTINPEDNEINEDIFPISQPGRIPGEGDCLLNGITYKNESIVPNSNKCHSSCRCVSSIIKCDPIICSPIPEYMDNCQLTYDTPDSCCPTYVCDHTKETIPPQPHSQMSGTESPLPSPSIDCNGDQCEVSKEKQPPHVASETDEHSEKPVISDCGAQGCDEPSQELIPVSVGCDGGQCESVPAEHLPDLKPSNDVSQVCENPDNCAEVRIPDVLAPPCEGDSCPSVVDGICDKEGNCAGSIEKPCEGDNCNIKPEGTPIKEVPQICKNEEDCQQTIVPEVHVPSCEGDSCKTIEIPCEGETCQTKPITPTKDQTPICDGEGNCGDTKIPEQPISPCTEDSCKTVKEDCSSGSCIPEVILPQTSPEDEICSKESGCTKPDIEAECTEESCRRTESSNVAGESPLPCSGSECVHQESPDKETTESGTLSTEMTISKETYATTPVSEIVTEKEEISTKLPEQEISTNLPEPQYTKAEGEATNEPEIIVTERNDVQTTIPDSAFTAKEEVITMAPEIYDSETKTPEYNVPDTTMKELELTTKLPEEYITKVPESGTETVANTTEVMDEETIRTESPDVVEPQKTPAAEPEVTEQTEVNTKTPELLDKYGEVQTEAHETHTTSSVESTTASDVLEKEDGMFTNAPELASTDFEANKNAPGSIVKQEEMSPDKETSTESLLTTPESTKDQEIYTEASEVSKEPETKVTEPETHTEKPEVFNETAIADVEKQEVATEALLEEGQSTALPDVTEPNEFTPKVPEFTFNEVGQTEESISSETIPQGLVTDSVSPQQTTEVPQQPITDTETSTKVADLPENNDNTNAPEVIEMDDKEFTTKSPMPHVTLFDESDSKTTTQISQDHEKLPEENIAEPLDISPTVEPQQETTTTELPLPTIGDLTTAAETSISGEENTQTESPLSLVTKSQEADATISQETSTEVSEEDIVHPDTTEKQPEISVVEEDLKTEKPESQEPQNTSTVKEEEQSTDQPITHAVESEQVFTESPHSLITEKEIDSKTPVSATEQPEKETSLEITTKIPGASVTISTDPSPTEQQELSTKYPSISETDESSITEEIIADTKLDVPSGTESPVHKEVSTDIPVPISTVKDIEIIPTEKTTEATESLVTKELEIATKEPEQASEEQGIYTTSPDVQESETKAPEVTILEETQTNLPELITQHPILSTESQETTDVPKPQEMVPDEKEIVVVPDGLTTEEEVITNIPESAVTESIKDKQITTARPGITLEQELETESVGQSFTKSQETITQTTEVSITTSHKEVTPGEYDKEQTTEVPASMATNLQETEQEKQTTESSEPSVSEQEQTSRVPESESTKLQEIEIKTEQPFVSATESLPPKDEETSKLPELQETTTKLETESDDQPKPVTAEPDIFSTFEAQSQASDQTKKPELQVTAITPQKDDENTEIISVESEATERPVDVTTKSTTTLASEEITETPKELEQTTEPQRQHSETTPYVVELEEHTHKIDEDISSILPSEEPTTPRTETLATEQDLNEISTEKLSDDEKQTEPSVKEQDGENILSTSTKEPFGSGHDEQSTTVSAGQEKPTEPSTSIKETSDTTRPESTDSQHTDDRYTTESDRGQDKEILTSTYKPVTDEEVHPTPVIFSETVKPSISSEEISPQPDKDVISSTTKPLEHDISHETTASEDEFVPATTKATTENVEPEVITQTPTLSDKFTKPDQKPSEIIPPTYAPEVPKPGLNELQPSDEVPEAPAPDEENQFPPSGGYGQDQDYVEEDQAFGPGTCRYGGKVYVSAQQIPRDDPCDFCFCFRSDIICLQQSCPPPIHGCHEEPIQGFCCPRYECPVSMATTLNVTTTTTTTTTTLPPHFLPHAYRGQAQRKGCQIKGHIYKVGEVVRASSGPCLHCTCGGDGQMKCDPKQCTPEPMLRQMIAAAVSAKRRR